MAEISEDVESPEYNLHNVLVILYLHLTFRLHRMICFKNQMHVVILKTTLFFFTGWVLMECMWETVVLAVLTKSSVPSMQSPHRKTDCVHVMSHISYLVNVFIVFWIFPDPCQSSRPFPCQ